MPDPVVVTVMRDYRRRLMSGEAAAMQQMATRWRDVERALRNQTLTVAREIWRLQAAGTPVPRGLLISLRHTQDLLGQVQRELDSYSDFADDLIRARQADTAALGVNAGTAAIQSVAPNVQFSRLPVSAVEHLVGLAGDGSPLRAVLQNAYGHGAEGILDVLVRGVAMGKNPRTMAAEAIRQGLSQSLNHMLVVMRTETLRVYRESTLETYRQSNVVRGYKRLSARDRRCCVACIAMDGREFPLSEPFAEHAQGRCLTPGTIVSGPVAQYFVSRYYVGDTIEIATASGNFLSVTPNHPILTDRGWIAAQFLKEGDNVISDGNREGIALDIDPSEYQIPTTIENIPRALNMNRLAVMPVAAENFHGDGIGSEVYIVWANRLLRNASDVFGFEPLIERDFGSGNMRHSEFFRLGDIASVLKGLRPSATGVLCNTDAPVMFGEGCEFCKELVSFGLGSAHNICCAQSHCDYMPTDTISDGESVFRFARQIPGNNFINRQSQFGESIRSSFLALDALAGGLVSEKSASLENIRKALLGSVKSSGNILRTIASNVGLDCILEISRVNFSGHVYNLQTPEQWYIANGIITHNCAAVPSIRGYDIDIGSGEKWFNRQAEDVQQAMLGPQRYALWKDGLDFERLAARREDARWGASYVPASLRELTG